MTIVAPSSLTPPDLEVPRPLLHRRPRQSPRPRRRGRHQLSMSPVVLSLLPHSLTLLLLLSLADLTASDYLDDNRMGILTTEDLATSGSGAIADYWMGGSIDDDDNDNDSSDDS
ncbi:hypothetical protein OsJ_33875 [Oryza sativa Japonica Group]|uniref:Uncharacterized protein n=1 Tax=Oryza sativa subsp. japonica TaxID=39947 RepID=B9GAN2_ORYSJ|nr:hypothetical protein OsJ_33875 [Oryza sativa Japonica Group]